MLYKVGCHVGDMLCVTEFEVHTDGVAWVTGCLVTVFG